MSNSMQLFVGMVAIGLMLLQTPPFDIGPSLTIMAVWLVTLLIASVRTRQE